MLWAFSGGVSKTQCWWLSPIKLVMELPASQCTAIWLLWGTVRSQLHGWRGTASAPQPCGAEEEPHIALSGFIRHSPRRCCVALQPLPRAGVPGEIFSAEMGPLVPGAVYGYRVGDLEADEWSEEAQFTAPPARGSQETVHFAIFGDMGTAMPDAGEEGPGFRDAHRGHQLRGGLRDPLGTSSCTRSRGVFRGVPWMVGIGNHERDAPGTSPARPRASHYNGTDSGGECGVPYAAHFPMPPRLRRLAPGHPLVLLRVRPRAPGGGLHRARPPRGVPAVPLAGGRLGRGRPRADALGGPGGAPAAVRQLAVPGGSGGGRGAAGGAGAADAALRGGPGGVRPPPQLPADVPA
ncbi:unnamed protein product, partial [Heterosigma akashiwo]